MEKPRVLAIIPARSGSKGLENKNIKELNGTTLIGHAIEFAKLCPNIEEIIISTDSLEYENIALLHGAKSLGLRPPHLSKDDTKTIDVILDILSHKSTCPEYLLLLQPTSPTRRVVDVEIIYDKINSGIYDGGVTISRIEDPHPYKLKRITTELQLLPFIDDASSETPRQLLPECFSLTGGIYMVKIDSILKSKTMLPLRTYGHRIEYPSVNVDTVMDYNFLKFLVESEKVVIYE